MATLTLTRKTAALWTSDNTVLTLNEIGFESDLLGIKLGDGFTAWVDLPYWPVGFGVAALFDLLSGFPSTGTNYIKFQTTLNTATYNFPELALPGVEIQFVKFGKFFWDETEDYTLTGADWTIVNSSEGIAAGTKIIIAYTYTPI